MTPPPASPHPRREPGALALLLCSCRRRHPPPLGAARARRVPSVAAPSSAPPACDAAADLHQEPASPRRQLLPPRLSATPVDAVQGTHGVVISRPSPVGSCVPRPSSWSSDARADPAAFLYSSRLEHLPLATTFVFYCCFAGEHRSPPCCLAFASRFRPRECLLSLGFDKMPSIPTFSMYIYTKTGPSSTAGTFVPLPSPWIRQVLLQQVYLYRHLRNR
ncbi:hypothetical protein VPH35_082314 [Triticum aestivum]